MNFNKADFYTSYGLFSQIPKAEKIEIAFSGRSNVGKSSLINKILGRKSLARVSSMPGKTVTINYYTLEDIYIVDLPGYGYAKVSKSEKTRWAGLVEGYLHDDRNLQLVFQLIDFRHPPTKDDLLMINFLIDNEIPFVIVLTKADKLKKREREERRKALLTEIPYGDQITMIEFSAENGEGTEEIRTIIEETVEGEEYDFDNSDNSDTAENS